MADITNLRGNIDPEKRYQVRLAAQELLTLAAEGFLDDSLHGQPWAWLTQEDADEVGAQITVAVEELLDELRELVEG